MKRNERITAAYVLGMAATVTFMLASSPTPTAEAVPLPLDPCLRCAEKALAGAYGELADWQKVGYQQFVKHGPTWQSAWTTQYYPSEGFWRGKGTRWSYPVNERCAAANELPGFSFVWSNRFGIRQVLDTGADSNDRHARDGTAHRLPADHWLDIWVPRAGMFGFTSKVMPIAAVRGRQPAKWKHGRKPKHAWLIY
jgi:hypothetical protein